jgi:hypothetical protein
LQNIVTVVIRLERLHQFIVVNLIGDQPSAASFPFVPLAKAGLNGRLCKLDSFGDERV